MEKYRRVERKKEHQEEDATTATATPIGENEIRVTQKGNVGRYISYGHRIFEEKENKTIILKALGNAISKCITVAEILKRTTAGLHQITQIGSMETVDVYEPLEEGLDVVKTSRHLPTITITLSMNELDKNNCGYQEPLPENMLRPTISSNIATRNNNGNNNNRGRGGRRGRGRNERNQNENKDNESTEEDAEHQHQKNLKEDGEEEQEERGEDETKHTGISRSSRGGKFRVSRGRGRGRGGRGRGSTRGRGAYSNRRDEERA